MKVQFKAPFKLNGKTYDKSPCDVADKLLHLGAFKKLIKEGKVFLLPRDAAAIEIQKGKDKLAVQKAGKAFKASKVS